MWRWNGREMKSGNEECLAADGVVVEEIKRLMDILHIPGVVFAPREANMAAHHVARFVARSFGRVVWLGVGPSWFMQIIKDDSPVTEVCNRNMGCGTSSMTVHSNNVIFLSD